MQKVDILCDTGWTGINKKLMDSELKIFYNLRNELLENDGIMFFNNRVVIPPSLQKQMVFLLTLRLILELIKLPPDWLYCRLQTMSNPEGLAVLAGLVFGGLIAVAVYFFNNRHNHGNNSGPPPMIPPAAKCPLCPESLLMEVKTLLCGHKVHKKCLYKELLKKNGLLGNHTCPQQGCRSRISDSNVDELLRSLCAVCEKEFDTDNTAILNCGHKLHKKCLEANYDCQLNNEPREPEYKCPYKLLRCNKKMSFFDVENLFN